MAGQSGSPIFGFWSDGPYAVGVVSGEGNDYNYIEAHVLGDPVLDGSWETARRIARNYDFADPSIVEAVFDREAPLEERTMLLILHFHALRVRVSVRVGDVYNEERELDQRPGRVVGWNYRTLEGHVEKGQMDWQVWKFRDTEEVLFRICCSRAPPAVATLS